MASMSRAPGRSNHGLCQSGMTCRSLIPKHGGYFFSGIIPREGSADMRLSTWTGYPIGPKLPSEHSFRSIHSQAAECMDTSWKFDRAPQHRQRHRVPICFPFVAGCPRAGCMYHCHAHIPTPNCCKLAANLRRPLRRLSHLKSLNLDNVAGSLAL